MEDSGHRWPRLAGLGVANKDQEDEPRFDGWSDDIETGVEVWNFSDIFE